jgi:hypothetical protein
MCSPAAVDEASMDVRRLAAQCSIGIWLSIALPATPAAAVVLVPADPAPAPGAQCASGARDVIASVQDTGRTSSPLQQSLGTLALRTASGGRRRVGLTAECPSVAASADGTAIVGFSVLRRRREGLHPRLTIRRPGTGFSAPIVPAAVDPRASGSHVVVPQVAAADGGWVAAAWIEATDHDRANQNRVAAVVVAPDGSLRTATFDVGSRNVYGQGVQISPPVVGIDAAGVATVAWTRYRVATDRRGDHVSEQTVRMARTTPGATTWLPAEDLAAGGDDPRSEQADEKPPNPRVGIAVAGGRVAIAWTTPTQVWIAEGQGSERPLPAPVADIAAASGPAVALGNGGAAVVSFLAPVGPPDEREARVLAIDRASPGTWSVPHPLWAPPAREDRYESDPQSPLAVALADDGKAVVTWMAFSIEGSQAMAATGRAGGPWTSARFVSAATRSLDFPPAAMVDAAGHPVALWAEIAPGARGRLQADRAIDDAAAPPDRVPPAVSFTTPRRMPLTRSGLVRPRALVTCSEACDVRLQLFASPNGGEIQTAVRSLAAGRRTPISLPLDKRHSEIIRNPNSIEPDRLEVLVTDRAGNVTRRSRHFTVKRGRAPKLDV